MSVQHYPRNPSLQVPMDVALFDGTTPQSGEASNIELRVVCLDNGYQLDESDMTFKASPTDPVFAVTAFSAFTYDYQKRLDASDWARGNYRGLFRHTGSGREYAFDFTVGLFVERGLGYSAIYTGTTLNLSVWVEENGEAQTDYTSLTGCTLLTATGGSVAGGSFATNNSPNDGIFNFQPTIALAANTNYVFKCNAVCPGPATLSNYSFPLRVGLARP